MASPMPMDTTMARGLLMLSLSYPTPHGHTRGLLMLSLSYPTPHGHTRGLLMLSLSYPTPNGHTRGLLMLSLRPPPRLTLPSFTTPSDIASPTPTVLTSTPIKH